MSGLLQQLAPIIHKKGWPWREETNPGIYNSKQSWPKISIVTPSYNQGQYIEETIRSILLQNYPNLEYIIIDGGSTDNTIEVIKKYAPWITYWVSEKDKGQADAINKGVEKCTGEIFNWINSDDLLTSECLQKVGSLYKTGVTVAGRVHNFFENNSSLDYYIQNVGLDFKNFVALKGRFHQPGIWCDLIAFKSAGNIPIQFTYYFDRIFLTKYFLYNTLVKYTDDILVLFRMHETSKTTTIYKSKNIELINFYKEILADEKYKMYWPLIRKTLYDSLIVTEYLNEWEAMHSQRSYLGKALSFLMIAVKHPRVMSSQFYMIKFKKNFISFDK